jgi:hypothetical protein
LNVGLAVGNSVGLKDGLSLGLRLIDGLILGLALGQESQVSGHSSAMSSFGHRLPILSATHAQFLPPMPLCKYVLLSLHARQGVGAPVGTVDGVALWVIVGAVEGAEVSGIQILHVTGHSSAMSSFGHRLPVLIPTHAQFLPAMPLCK